MCSLVLEKLTEMLLSKKSKAQIYNYWQGFQKKLCNFYNNLLFNFFKQLICNPLR